MIIIISAGVILGFLLGGRVTDSLGSLYVFLLGSLLSALGFFYGLVRVNNICKVGDLSSSDPETRLRRFTTAEAAISAGVILGFL